YYSPTLNTLLPPNLSASTPPRIFKDKIFALKYTSITDNKTRNAKKDNYNSLWDITRPPITKILNRLEDEQTYNTFGNNNLREY
ncbi:38637_t:CDS:2, partial [Gigaspora margarita]